VNIAFPFRIGTHGRTAVAGQDDYIRGLIEQVLFTAPGERVNRPEFGSGLDQALFSPNRGDLSTATQFLLQGALQQWMGDLIAVQAVSVENDEETLLVAVQYIVLESQEQKIARFEGGIP